MITFSSHVGCCWPLGIGIGDWGIAGAIEIRGDFLVARYYNESYSV